MVTAGNRTPELETKVIGSDTLNQLGHPPSPSEQILGRTYADPGRNKVFKRLVFRSIKHNHLLYYVITISYRILFVASCVCTPMHPAPSNIMHNVENMKRS